MKNRIGVLLILATIIIPAIVAKALTQTGGYPSATITSVSEGQPGSGQVNVNGTYIVPAGYTFTSITVDVRPANGAAREGAEGAATTDGMGNFSGTYTVPTQASYDIQAYLTFTDSSNNVGYVFSNTESLLVY